MTPDPGIVILVVSGILFATGLYALSSRNNMIKMVIGIEFLGKGTSLIFIFGGYLAGNTGNSQAVVFTLIAIEAVVAGLALALVILSRRVWNTLDITGIPRQIQRGER